MDDIKKLENRLKDTMKVPVSSQVSGDIKKRLFLSIQNAKKTGVVEPSYISSLINRVREIFTTVKMSPTRCAFVKERVLEFVSSYSRPRFFFSRFFFAYKAVWASFIIFMILLNLFVFVDYGIPVAEAKYTLLKEVSGSVYVHRGDTVLNGRSDFILEEGDVIQTGGEGSKAVIRFFDDSISRLRENTEVTLSRLFIDDAKNLVDVVVGVYDGEVWAKVCSFSKRRSEFTIVSKDVLAQASDNATFNVSANSERKEFKVDVLENKINVHVVSDDSVLTESVLEGSSAKVTAETSTIQIGDVDVKDEWISSNLSEDKEHVGDVIAETKEEVTDAAGVLPESILHPVKLIKEDAQLLLTFSDVERARVKLDIAEKRLLEAEAMAFAGTSDLPVDVTIDEFQKAADEFLVTISVLKETDMVQYVDLLTYVNKKMNKHKRNLLFVNSDVPDEDLDADVASDVTEDNFIKPLAVEEEPVIVEEEPEIFKQAAPALDIYFDETSPEPVEAEELDGSDAEETQDNS